MTTEEMQKQIESMMPTPNQIVESIDKNLRNNMADIMKAKQYINDYTRNCSNELSNGEYESWLTPDQALRAAEIAREESFLAGAEWQLNHPTSDYAWKIYNFIWDYKYGKFGENLTLQQAIEKYFKK